MSLRKFLIFFKYFRKYRQSKRRVNKIRVEMLEKEKEFADKLKLQDLFYQKRLATEAKRFELMMVGWADRLCQDKKLIPVSIAQADIDDKVDKLLLNSDKKQTDIPDLLTYDQNMYFENLKSNFWTQGRQDGKSEAEINMFWENQVKLQAIEDSKNAFAGGMTN